MARWLNKTRGKPFEVIVSEMGTKLCRRNGSFSRANRKEGLRKEGRNKTYQTPEIREPARNGSFSRGKFHFGWFEEMKGIVLVGRRRTRKERRGRTIQQQQKRTAETAIGKRLEKW